MSLAERLMDFAGSIGAAATKAPDEYLQSSRWTYESHKADLKELWAEIRPQLKRDIDKAQLIDEKLQEMFAAFDAGEKDKGREVAWSIYDLKLEKLK
jgi:hypothetical protein